MPEKIEHTVDGERFAGLDIHGFSAIEVLMEILSCCLAMSTHYLVQLKTGTYIHVKTLTVLRKTVKNMKVQPSESFLVYGRQLYMLIYTNPLTNSNFKSHKTLQPQAHQLCICKSKNYKLSVAATNQLVILKAVKCYSSKHWAYVIYTFS